MSDYLTRLAERALGVADLIQPLQASMFSPAEIRSGLPVPELQNAGQPPLKNAEQTAAGFNPERPAPMPLPARPQTKREVSSECYSGPAQPETVNEGPDGFVRADNDSNPEDGRENLGKERRTLSKNKPFQHLASPPRPAPTKLELETTTNPVRKEPTAFLEEQPVEDELPKVPRNRQKPVSIPAPMLLLKQEKFQPQVNAVFGIHASSEAYFGRSDKETCPPPAIQVTIGRVEIRGLMPAPPKPPEKAIAGIRPAMSLEEYVKKRKEGNF